MYFVAWSIHSTGTEEARLENSDAMKTFLHNHSHVILHHGGPTLDDDAETVVGGLMIIEAPSLEMALRFVIESPFGEAGIFDQCHVLPSNWLTGRPSERQSPSRAPRRLICKSVCMVFPDC